MATDRRDVRFFDGDAGELQRIRSMESLQRFERGNRLRKRLGKLSRALIFIVLCAVFIGVCLNFFFVIGKVEVTGSDSYTGEELMKLAGVEMGDSLYGVNSGDFALLPARLANIRSVSISRIPPGTLVIKLTQDVPVYYTELYGEYFMLSDELRVLDRVFDEEQPKAAGYIRVELPELDRAVVGSKVVFHEPSDERYVAAYLSAVMKSAVADRVDAFDLRDRFELKLICGGYKYLAQLAGGDDLTTKLSTLAQVLSHEALDGKGPARIDITNPAQARAIFDISGEVAFDP